MSVETAADRAVFVSANDFGVSATYTPSGGAAATLSVIFDKTYFEDQALAGITGHQPIALAGIAGHQPMALARTSDLTGTIVGGTLVVSSVTYTIVNAEDDGTGFTPLILEPP